MKGASVSSAILRTGFSLLLCNGVRHWRNLCVLGLNTCQYSTDKSTDMSSITSIHGAHIKDVHEVPFNILIRPFPSELEENKVLSLIETLQDPNQQDRVPPIDVLWVIGTEGGNYYYSFGGCHRYEAHRRLGLPTIQSKLIKSTIEDLKTYLGGSTPDLK